MFVVGYIVVYRTTTTTIIYRSLLYNTAGMKENRTRLHSHPIFMGMDDGRQYYGVYLETGGAPVEIEVMPG